MEPTSGLLQVRLPDDPLLASLLFLLITVAPPALFAVSLRNAERHRREPWFAVAKAFAWGGTVGVLLAIVAQVLLEPFLGTLDPWAATFSLATVVLAPVTEELAKALGLGFVRDRDPEPEDGFIYGGALGLGFAATENILYVLTAFLLQGVELALVTAIYRGVVTVALHGAVSAIAGYGIWRARWGGSPLFAAAAVLLAILVHALYNGLVTASPPFATLLAGGGAVYAFLRVRKRVKALDRRAEGLAATWEAHP